MEFEFTGKCVVTMEHKKGETTSSHVSTDFNLDVSKNLNRSQYLDKGDLPTKDGIKPLTQCFIQGLVGNIHMAHQKGFWNDAEHLRYIISELEKGFVAIANVSESNFKD